MPDFDLGDVVRVIGTWTDADDVAVDPAAVFFQIKDPGRNVTSYEYGVDAEVVKSDSGIYYVDVDGDKARKWFVRLYSTGSGKAAEESDFDIVKSEF